MLLCAVFFQRLWNKKLRSFLSDVFVDLSALFDVFLSAGSLRRPVRLKYQTQVTCFFFCFFFGLLRYNHQYLHSEINGIEVLLSDEGLLYVTT